MLITFAFLLGQRFPLRPSGSAALAFALTLLLGWALFKRDLGIGLAEAYRDWIFAVPVAMAAALLALGWLTPWRANTLLLAAAAALGVGLVRTVQSRSSRRPRSSRNTRRRSLPISIGGCSARAAVFFCCRGARTVSRRWGCRSSRSVIRRSPTRRSIRRWTCGRSSIPDVPPDELNRTFNNVGTFGFGDVPRPSGSRSHAVGPMAPVRQARRHGLRPDSSGTRRHGGFRRLPGADAAAAAGAPPDVNDMEHFIDTSRQAPRRSRVVAAQRVDPSAGARPRPGLGRGDGRPWPADPREGVPAPAVPALLRPIRGVHRARHDGRHRAGGGRRRRVLQRDPAVGGVARPPRRRERGPDRLGAGAAALRGIDHGDPDAQRAAPPAGSGRVLPRMPAGAQARRPGLPHRALRRGRSAGG